MFKEPAEDADDSLEFINYRSYISEVADDLRFDDDAWDLQYDLHGESVLCYCGCGTMFPKPGGDYDRWEFDHNRNHLSWLYG